MADSVQNGRRHFYYWCPNCETTLHVETAVTVSDEPRGVDVVPNSEHACPMCETSMVDWDEIAAFDESFRNKGSWEDVARWRSKFRKDVYGG